MNREGPAASLRVLWFAAGAHLIASAALVHRMRGALVQLAEASDPVVRHAALSNGLSEYLTVAICIPSVAPLAMALLLLPIAPPSGRRWLVLGTALTLAWSAAIRSLTLLVPLESLAGLVSTVADLPGPAALLTYGTLKSLSTVDAAFIACAMMCLHDDRTPRWSVMLPAPALLVLQHCVLRMSCAALRHLGER